MRVVVPWTLRVQGTPLTSSWIQHIVDLVSIDLFFSSFMHTVTSPFSTLPASIPSRSKTSPVSPTM